MPLHIGLHTWPVTACGGMSIGDKGSLKTAQILAGCGYDLMTDADLRAAAMADFRQPRRRPALRLAAAARPQRSRSGSIRASSRREARRYSPSRAAFERGVAGVGFA